MYTTAMPDLVWTTQPHASTADRRSSKARPGTPRPPVCCRAPSAATGRRRGGGSHCATRGAFAAGSGPRLAARTHRARSGGAARSHAAHRHPSSGRVR
eukprot:scaffold4613_cov77-Phaeocystis_antarctica.AAC.2